MSVGGPSHVGPRGSISSSFGAGKLITGSGATIRRLGQSPKSLRAYLYEKRNAWSVISEELAVTSLTSPPNPKLNEIRCASSFHRGNGTARKPARNKYSTSPLAENSALPSSTPTSFNLAFMLNVWVVSYGRSAGVITSVAGLSFQITNAGLSRSGLIR